MDSNGTNCPPTLRVSPWRTAESRGPCAAAGGSRFQSTHRALPPAGAVEATPRSLRSVGGDRSCDHWLAFARLDQLHIKAKRLQLANQNVERLGHTRLDGRFAFDDGLVNLGAAIHVIGLRGQQFLQDVRRSIRFQGPDFHFSEALATELRLAAQRLLGDQRVRPDGTRVDLVVDQVGEFEHVDVTDRDRLLELVTRHAVVQIRLARTRQFAFGQQRLDLELLGAVEYRRCEVHSFLHAVGYVLQGLVVEARELVNEGRVFEQDLHLPAKNFRLGVLLQQLANLLTDLMTCPTQVRLQDLSDVHAAGYAQRVEDDLDRRPVLEVRHVLFGEDAGEDALVTVAPGHLVADAQLALPGA